MKYGTWYLIKVFDSRLGQISRWLSYYWYSYLFKDLRHDLDHKLTMNRYAKLTWRESFNRLICRYRGHPCGQVYFNPRGYEPDEHCKNCGDII